jgi:hypothetical protein
LLPIAQYAINTKRSATTGYSPYKANYGYEPFDSQGTSIGTDDKASLINTIHKELQTNIELANGRAAVQANKKRIEGPILKEGDKVFLLRKNLKTKRPCKKLDYLRIGPFRILEKRGLVNYKLELPKNMRVYPVFHISKLELAP